MKLTAYELKKCIQAQSFRKLRAFLFYGDDEGRVGHLSQQLITSLLESRGGDRSGIVRLDVEQVRDQSGLLAETVAAIPLFGGPQVITVGPLVSRDSKEVERALEYATEDQALVIKAASLRSGDKLLTLFQNGTASSATPLFREGEVPDLIADLREIATSKGFSYDDLAAKRLADLVASGEVGRGPASEQWALLGAAVARIEPQHITALFGETHIEAMSPLIHAFLDGKLAAGAKALESLLQFGLPPVALLRGLQTSLLQLWEGRIVYDGKKYSGKLTNALSFRIFFRDENRFEDRVRGWPRAYIERALLRLIQAEAIIKSGKVDRETTLYGAVLPILHGLHVRGSYNTKGGQREPRSKRFARSR